MNARKIAALRADSLDAVLTAARRRRIRRRAVTVFGSTAVVAIIGMLVGPGRNPPRRPGEVSSHGEIAAAPRLPAPPSHIIRTTASSVIRINTATKPAVVRFTTPRTAVVQRIDTPALANLFPRNGVAVVHANGNSARAFFFLSSTERGRGGR
jgi:hypothetical protein